MSHLVQNFFTDAYRNPKFNSNPEILSAPIQAELVEETLVTAAGAIVYLKNIHSLILLGTLYSGISVSDGFSSLVWRLGRVQFNRGFILATSHH